MSCGCSSKVFPPRHRNWAPGPFSAGWTDVFASGRAPAEHGCQAKTRCADLASQGASMRFVRWFSEVGLSDVDLVGGKNASLGEMIRELARLGIRVPDGFAVTAEAYREFLRAAELERPLDDLLSGVRREDIDDLVERSARIRKLILS